MVFKMAKNNFNPKLIVFAKNKIPSKFFTVQSFLIMFLELTNI